MKNIIIMILSFGLLCQAQQYDFYSFLAEIDSQYTVLNSRLGGFNLQSGSASAVGPIANPVWLPFGAGSINAQLQLYNIVTAATVRTYDLDSMNLVTDVPVNCFHSGNYNFFNTAYNTSDNTLYGLCSIFGPNYSFLGMYLSKLNTNTGDLTKVSDFNIGGVVELAGKAIDPELMVYYYSNSQTFYGIDLYQGTVFSSPAITFESPGDIRFQNFTYNCADNTIYGLITEDTYIVIPNSMGIYDTRKNVRLGKINPQTGVVSRVLPTTLLQNGWSGNAGSTIDPISNAFYYSDGYSIHGVSLATGALLQSRSFNFTTNIIVNNIESKNNCYNAIQTRLNPLAVKTNTITPKVLISPNPVQNVLGINANIDIDNMQVFDSNGRSIFTVNGNEKTIDVSGLQTGIYFLRLNYNQDFQTIKFSKN